MNWRKYVAKTGIYQMVIMIKKLFQKPVNFNYNAYVEGGYLYQWQANLLNKIKGKV